MRSTQTSHLGRVGEASADAVVVTDSVSVNADYDNGTVALYGASRYGRDDECATRRVDPTCRRSGTSKIYPVRAASNMANLYAPTHKLWSCLGSHGDVE